MRSRCIRGSSPRSAPLVAGSGDWALGLHIPELKPSTDSNGVPVTDELFNG